MPETSTFRMIERWSALIGTSLGIVSGIFALIVGIWGIVVFASGGIQTGNAAAILTLQTDVKSIKSDVGDIRTQLGMMPRPVDMADITTHLHALDERADRQQTAISDHTSDIAVVKNQIATLNHQSDTMDQRLTVLESASGAKIRQP